MARSPRGREYGARRSRSRSRERRYDDRGGDRRRDRGRYDDRRSGRDRSRDRRDAYRRDDRYDDRYRDRYDDRPSKRPRRDDSSPPRRSHRDDSRERRGAMPKQEKEIGPDPAIAEEEAKKARAARVAAWKEKTLGQKTPGTGDASASPVVGSPAALSQNSPKPDSPIPAPETSSPAPYAGKFDPKLIKQRAAAAMERQKALGGDVAIPKSTNQAASIGKAADYSKVAPSSFSGASTFGQRGAKITGVRLNKTNEKQDKSTIGKGALEEDVEVSRKLEKLPDAPIDTEDAALANVTGSQDDGDEEDALDSDEEEAEEIRAAALRRAEEAQAEGTQQNSTMTGIESTAVAPTNDVEMNDAEDEVDPLDAFMDTLQEAPAPKNQSKGGRQVFNNSDDEGDMDAVGGMNDDFLAMAAKRKKKDIPTINHGKVDYEDFRKDFYSESVELADLTPEDVEVLRADLDNITCRGINIPKPIVKWSQGGFGAQILDVIRQHKFEKPSAIQSQALPAVMSGRDVIGIAKTGSGKTLAFILPMFRHIKDQRPVENLEGPIGLVLAPTRELAVQIHRDCKPYVKALGLRSVCAYGGAPIKDQIAELKRGAEIVVCTAGRFIDLLAANNGRVTNLRRVTYVVLDEADRMFDMGFEPQITKILNNIRPDRQTILFSATFPKSMEALARKALHKPIEILVGGRSVVAPEVTQMIEVRSETTKFKRMLELVGDILTKDDDARSLIFVERQEAADTMLKDLLFKGYPSVSVHGGREQDDRDQSVRDFKAGIYPIMIATSVAARGLDVKQLKLVVNYDCPNHLEDYVHRVGRTGRAGTTGTAVTFVTPEQDRFAPFLIRALTDSSQTIPDDLLKLKETHDENVKAGQARKAGSGFGGRGIERLDAARDADRARERKQFKTGDEPDDDDDADKAKTEKGKNKIDDMVAKATGAVQDRDSKTQQGILPDALSNALTNAMKIQKAATPPPASTTPAAAAGGDAISRAKAAAATIGNRLGKGSGAAAKSGPSQDNRGPDAGAFHATLEVNDFPQRARWGVTNRTNVSKVLDLTQTSITNKGEYYPPGKEPGPGDPPKLYVLVEGDTERQVESAMAQLTAHLKQGTLDALEQESRAQGGGRYTVV